MRKSSCTMRTLGCSMRKSSCTMHNCVSRPTSESPTASRVYFYHQQRSKIQGNAAKFDFMRTTGFIRACSEQFHNANSLGIVTVATWLTENMNEGSTHFDAAFVILPCWSEVVEMP